MGTKIPLISGYLTNGDIIIVFSQKSFSPLHLAGIVKDIKKDVVSNIGKVYNKAIPNKSGPITNSI